MMGDRRQIVNRTEDALSKFIVAMQYMCYYLQKFYRSDKMPQKASNLGSKKQNDIIKLLDSVAKTGIPAELERKGKRLVILPVEKKRDLDKLEKHPEFFTGDPDDLVHVDWSSECEHGICSIWIPMLFYGSILEKEMD